MSLPLAFTLEGLAPAAIALWLFAVGASIGSFLNVVIYRLPRGLSLVHPGSRCPACAAPIRWHDNIPVLGWLLLRGRCRACAGRIAVRYPLVEGLCGAMFVVLAVMTSLSAWRAAEGYVVRFDMSMFWAQATIGLAWGVYSLHALLLCTLLAAAFIEYDQQRVPRRLFAPCLIVAVLAPLAWPELRLLHFSLAPAGWTGSGWRLGLMDGVCGALAGAVLGELAYRVRGKMAASHSNGRTMRFGLLYVGLVLGWQVACLAAFTVGAAYLITTLIARTAGSRPWTAAWGFLLVSTVLLLEAVLLEFAVNLMRGGPWFIVALAGMAPGLVLSAVHITTPTNNVSRGAW